MSEFYTDLENRLSKISAPAMPADVESRVRQRLNAQTAQARKRGPLGGLLLPRPAFAAQIAVLAALIAMAVALFAHDVGTKATTVATPPTVGASASAPNYVATFSVPTIKNGPTVAPQVSHTIAPPTPPPTHHR